VLVVREHTQCPTRRKQNGEEIENLTGLADEDGDDAISSSPSSPSPVHIDCCASSDAISSRRAIARFPWPPTAQAISAASKLPNGPANRWGWGERGCTLSYAWPCAEWTKQTVTKVVATLAFDAKRLLSVAGRHGAEHAV